MVCFHYPIPIPRPTPMQIQKGYTGTDSDGDSYAKSQWKLVKFHLIGTDIGAKMGTVAHWNQNWHMHRNRNRFTGNTSAHYYYSHFHRNQNRNRSRAVETHHYTELSRLAVTGIQSSWRMKVFWKFVLCFLLEQKKPDKVYIFLDRFCNEFSFI